VSAVIHDDIRTLLDAPPTGDEAPTLDTIEDTLTTGYARALALEAERWRLERKIAELAAKVANAADPNPTSELADLSRNLTAADGSLAQLRGLLASLRMRADEVRAAV
jgi:hypothetical protein